MTPSTDQAEEAETWDGSDTSRSDERPVRCQRRERAPPKKPKARAIRECPMRMKFSEVPPGPALTTDGHRKMRSEPPGGVLEAEATVAGSPTALYHARAWA